MHDLPVSSISIVVPVYNERATVEMVIRRLDAIELRLAKEVLVVDDGSGDGTREIVMRLAEEGLVKAHFHGVNLGKGAALRTAFSHALGDIVLIQDADSEYDPDDISRVVQPIVDGRADIVYGSRFRGEAQRVHLFWHRVANAMLTFLSNMLTNLNLSDMECGYKAFRKEVIQKLQIRENRFGVEPELTAKIAKGRYRIYEVPVSYAGRDYSEGKKIGVKDALRALWCIIRYRIAD